MKKLTFLTTLLLLMTVGVFAQKVDTTVVINNHEYCISDDKDDIKINIYGLKDGVRTTKEPIYESRFFKKTVSDGRVHRFSFSTYNDEMEGRETEDVSFWFSHELKQPLPSLYFSHLEFSNSDGTLIDMHNRPSSFEWGGYSPITILCTKGGHFGVSTGFGISNSYNFLYGDYVMMMDKGKVKIEELSVYTEGRFEKANKSFLRYWSLRLPVMSQLQWKVGREYLSISAGAELEWRFWMRSFARYDGAKRTISDDLNYRAIGCNALLQIGYGGCIVFGRIGLTELFTLEEQNPVWNACQVSVGIGYNFD